MNTKESVSFDQYQKEAWRTSDYPNKGENIEYPTLGLCGECGEFANKIKKIQRDDNKILTETRRQQLIDELGDCLWYIAALATELECNLEWVAIKNIDKLNNRVQKNTLHGEGDLR